MADLVSRRRTTLLLLIVLAGAASLASCAAPAPRGPSAIAPLPAVAAASRVVSSNVLFADYAGTRACEMCHADTVATWQRSPMHNMTRDPSVAEVRGPFDGTTFRF